MKLELNLLRNITRFSKKKQYNFVQGIEYCTVHQNSPDRKLNSKITDSVQNGQKTHKIR